MTTNPRLARHVIEKLLAAGVREFCICAGARNAPLVAQLFETKDVAIFSFFEERSASFFALGRIRESGRPVAVVMTSGTAVAECLPAVIEARYQGLPLLILSADRPRAYRGTGAPQAIEQVGIFADSVEKCLDIASPEEALELGGWSRQRALHLNVCFEEPRADDIFESVLSAPAPAFAPASVAESEGVSAGVLTNPVVLIGPLREFEKPYVMRFLEGHDLPFVAEAPSGLELSSALMKRRILCPEKTLPAAIARGDLSSVIRLGGVPTLRFWRDLEEKYAALPVVSVSSLEFSGLARPSRLIRGFSNLSTIETSSTSKWDLSKDREAFVQLQGLWRRYPRAEASLIRRFAEASHRDWVYLGNSLPIREWDLVASDLVASKVWANRGANGIDGQISSFLGWTQTQGDAAWALIGDLTALYDLASLWVTPQLVARPRRLVIVNNFGGQIFRPMFQNKMFLNSHEIGFQKWAEMWRWDYRLSTSGDELSAPSLRDQIIELRPDQNQSDQFSQDWKQS